jgi:ABC-type polysaccharide/polyol phosphate export permease
MFKLKEYKNLIKTISITDFKLKYEGSILGYLWSLVKPLFLFTVLYFVFTQVFKLGNAIPHYPVYLLLGIVIWTYFLETTISCLLSIVGKRDLIRKVYFPRVVLIISNSLTSLLTFLANLVIVLVFMAFNRIVPTWHVMFIPLLLFEICFCCRYWLNPKFSVREVSRYFSHLGNCNPGVVLCNTFTLLAGISSWNLEKTSNAKPIGTDYSGYEIFIGF